MENLGKLLQKLLANNFVFYLKAHKAHWNVTGLNFAEHHKFLETVYTQLWGNVDTIAEQIRGCNFLVQASLADFFNDSSNDSGIEDPVDDLLTDAETIYVLLNADNDKLKAAATEALTEAKKVGNEGVVNFLADLLDQHNKLGWMLRASVPGEDKPVVEEVQAEPVEVPAPYVSKFTNEI
jgi:starvation-inducible DNA-binding protein